MGNGSERTCAEGRLQMARDTDVLHERFERTDLLGLPSAQRTIENRR